MLSALFSIKGKVLSIKVLLIISLFLILYTYPLSHVYANHLDGEGWFCEGNSVVQQLPNGDHEVWQDCGENEQCTPLDPPAGYSSDADCKPKDQTGGSGSDSTSTTTTNKTSQDLVEPGASPNGEPIKASNYNAPQHSNYTLINLQHSLFCELAGMSPVDDCIGIKKDSAGKPQAMLYKQIPGGCAVGGLTNVMVALYTNPPTSTADYLADLGENLGFAKPAYAQNQVGGSGEGIIKPIRTLWQVSRNLSYVIFILVFVVVGLMIMFRSRINPQTVIGLQQALPGLVIGLILVTFSYFIASLLIDTSFLGMRVVGEFFIQSGADNFFGGTNPDGTNGIRNLAESSNVFHLFAGSFRFSQNFMDVTGGIWRTVGSTGGGTGASVAFGVIMPAIIGALIGFFTLGPIAAIGGGIIGAGIVPVLGLLIPLILIVVMIIQFFKLLFKLIMAYITLLVTTIIGPFLILASSIPGRGGTLGLWWKAILANALIFPAVFAAFLFAGLIIATNPGDWSTSPPLFGGLSTELLRFILAYGIILGTPAIPDMVKNALGVKDLAGGIGKEALVGTITGIGAVTPVGSGVGRFGINVLHGATRVSGQGGVWQQFNARLGRLLKGGLLRDDVRQ